jgi:type I restriction enzyme R subunit
LLEHQGYQYSHGNDIAPDSGNANSRSGFDEVVLTHPLKAAIRRLNPTIPAEAQEDAYRQVLRVNSPQLVLGNYDCHRMLTEGVNVNYRSGSDSAASNERGDFVRLIDFDQPENNDFCVVNQFTIQENHKTKRPDILIFVNGLPLVVIELKNAADENATISSAYRQIQTYKDTIPSLFTYNAFIVISDGLEAKAGTISAGFNRFMAWKTEDGKAEASHLVSQLEVLIKGMLQPGTLLDLVRNFIVFEQQ